MPLQLFLNELSVPTGQVARAISVSHLRQLVATVREARKIDRALILNCHVPLANFPLCEGETIASVRNDGDCVEESLYLKTVNNRAPLVFDAPEPGGNDPDLCEYSLRSTAPLRAMEAALGLGFAHFFDGLSVSLASNDYWCVRSVELDLAKIDMDSEIVTAQVEARNADSVAGITYHEAALRAILAPTVASGAELWARRDELLANLKFIPRTRAQIEGILAGDPMLDQAWIKLSGIDQAISAWKVAKGPYPMFPFSVRPESKSRQKLVKFNDAEGYERTFSDHCDLAPTEGRIHFIVESEPEPHVLVGHVGRKLGIG